MPRPSNAESMLSDAALGSLKHLGQRLKDARLKRNWTQTNAAEKAGLSDSSVKKVENGAVNITVAAYLALLDVYGQPTGLDDVFAEGSDAIGDALSRTQARKRARTPQTQDSEWDF